MKILCPVCGCTEELSKELLDEVSTLRNKYGLSAIWYIRTLNAIRGKCLSSDEHAFEFDEEFMATIKDIVNKDKADKEAGDMLVRENIELTKQNGEMEYKIKENKLKIELNAQKIEDYRTNISKYAVLIKDLTGADDISIWY